MTKFICEIGSNHNGSLSRCYDIIDAAREMGCWSVKFQLFKAHKLYAPEFKDKIKAMKKWELPENFIIPIKRYCIKKDIKFICTPFDLESVEILKPHVDLFKIGSYELCNHDLIKAIAKTDKPWILSIGMSSDNEVENALDISNQHKNLPIALLYCNSNYPAHVKDCNLLDAFKAFRLLSHGWSDHTVEPGVIYKAIALGAEIIEFHMDLDGSGFEYQIGHCWLPHQMKEVIRNVKIGEEACLPVNSDKDDENRKWRTDPEDGMRPLKKYRKELLK